MMKSSKILITILMFMSLQLMGQHVGVNEETPLGEFHVSDPFVFQGITFVGIGVNDLSVNQNGYNGTGEINYAVEITESVEVPNYFRWSDDAGISWSSEIPIPLGHTDLGDGIKITFESNFGHRLGDIWTFTFDESYLNGLIVVDGKVGLGTSNPTKQLDVQGDVNLTGDFFKNGVLFSPAESIDELSDGKNNGNSLSLGTHSGSMGAGNTFIGNEAGSSNTFGHSNSFVGRHAGFSNQFGFGNSFLGFEAGNNTTSSENTFLGFQSGKANTSGEENIFIGAKSGISNQTGSFNVLLGYEAGFFSTADFNVFVGYKSGKANTSGNANLFLGHRTGFSNQTGFNNNFLGYDAGYSNTTGRENVFNGTRAGYSNTIGIRNLFAGLQSGYTNSTGSRNVFLGSFSGYKNESGADNIFIGPHAGYSNTLGFANIFNGQNAGYLNTVGNYNVMIGPNAGYNNSAASENVFIGREAGFTNTTALHNVYVGAQSGFDSNAADNTFVGYQAGFKNTSGNENTYIGKDAGMNSTTPYGNTFVGEAAAKNNTTGIRNTCIGGVTNLGNLTGSRNTAIGRASGSRSISTNNCTYLGYAAECINSSGTITNSTAIGYASRVTSDDQIRIGNNDVSSIGGFAAWTNLSDGRFKKDIQENVKGLSFIKSLRPVTYKIDQQALQSWRNNSEQEIEYQNNSTGNTITHTGFIAQEVESSAHEIGYEFSGVDVPQNDQSHYGLRYATFVVPLVKAVQEQQAMIEDLQAKIEALNQLLKNNKN